MTYRNDLPKYLHARRSACLFFSTFNSKQRSKRINVNETDEVYYWTQALGVPKEKLIVIVEEVGNAVADVRKALRR